MRKFVANFLVIMAILFTITLCHTVFAHDGPETPCTIGHHRDLNIIDPQLTLVVTEYDIDATQSTIIFKPSKQILPGHRIYFYAYGKTVSNLKVYSNHHGQTNPPTHNEIPGTELISNNDGFYGVKFNMGTSVDDVVTFKFTTAGTGLNNCDGGCLDVLAWTEEKNVPLDKTYTLANQNELPQAYYDGQVIITLPIQDNDEFDLSDDLPKCPGLGSGFPSEINQCCDVIEKDCCKGQGGEWSSTPTPKCTFPNNSYPHTYQGQTWNCGPNATPIGTWTTQHLQACCSIKQFAFDHQSHCCATTLHCGGTTDLFLVYNKEVCCSVVPQPSLTSNTPVGTPFPSYSTEQCCECHFELDLCCHDTHWVKENGDISYDKCCLNYPQPPHASNNNDGNDVSHTAILPPPFVTGPDITVCCNLEGPCVTDCNFIEWYEWKKEQKCTPPGSGTQPCPDEPICNIDDLTPQTIARFNFTSCCPLQDYLDKCPKYPKKCDIYGGVDDWTPIPTLEKPLITEDNIQLACCIAALPRGFVNTDGAHIDLYTEAIAVDQNNELTSEQSLRLWKSIHSGCCKALVKHLECLEDPEHPLYDALNELMRLCLGAPENCPDPVEPEITV